MRYLGWTSLVPALLTAVMWAAPDRPPNGPSKEPGDSGDGVEGRLEGRPRIETFILEPDPVPEHLAPMRALWVDPFVVIEWARSDGTHIRVEAGGNPLESPGIRWTRFVRHGGGAPRAAPLAPGDARAIWDAVAASRPESWQGRETFPDRLTLRYGTTRSIADLPSRDPSIARVLALLAQGE